MAGPIRRGRESSYVFSKSCGNLNAKLILWFPAKSGLLGHARWGKEIVVKVIDKVK